ncbi:MAG TPA: hypothetical protein VEA61_04790 [Allosphingosinicella sp.]|nr:hypothetical protein [Allosphingosinicella sp.]
MAAVTGGFWVWMNWPSIKDKPGVEWILDRLTREPIPKADPRRFSVAVARLENDRGREHERLILALLGEFKGVQVLQIDRRISAEHVVREEGVKKAHAKARKYLKESGASVLIWGSVLQLEGKAKPALYMTTAGEMSDEDEASGEARQYTPLVAQEFSLPEAFWSDLSEVLRLLIVSNASRFHAATGRPVAGELEPFVSRVRNLLQSPRVRWDEDSRRSTRVILADALWRLAIEKGGRESLRKAADLYEAALINLSPESDARNWAAIQRSLLGVRRALGEGGMTELRQTVGVLNRVLQIYDRNEVPLDWAFTQHDLANTLSTIGEQIAPDRDAPEVDQAIAKLHLAAQVFEEQEQSLAWASAKNDLGMALRVRADRRAGKADKRAALQDLDLAAAAYRDALRVHRESTLPQLWAASTINLGITLDDAGRLVSDEARVVRAIAEFNKVRRVVGPETYPAYWAEANNGLGNALTTLGKLRRDVRLIRHADRVFGEALEIRDGVLDLRVVGMIQNNRAVALRSLAQLRCERLVLVKAEAALAAARQAYVRAGDPYGTAVTGRSLADVRTDLRKGCP